VLKYNELNLTTRHLLSFLAFSFVGLASAVNAHHSTATHYDSDKPITLDGVVSGFDFVNPHVVLWVEVPDENGHPETWGCIGGAANTMARQGWTQDQFVPGQKVTVMGIAARRNVRGCAFLAVFSLPELGEIEPPTLARDIEAYVYTDELAPVDGAVRPDLAGPWMRDRNQRSAAPEPGDERPGEELFTPEGWAAQTAYDPRFDDPSLECNGASIARLWSELGTPTDIEQYDDRMIIHHEYMDTERIILLGTRQHPADVAPSQFGHSVGWYEGLTLVIDTVGFTAGVLIPQPGVLHSDALHMVEHLTNTPREGALELEWLAEDPKYFKSPIAGSGRFVLSPYELAEYGCMPGS
jgi:hypothetical protein